MQKSVFYRFIQKIAALAPFERVLLGGFSLCILLPVCFWILADPGYTNLIFDIEVPFEVKKSDSELKAELAAAIAAEAPDFFAVITVDRI